jgi:hypothetical protein
MVSLPGLWLPILLWAVTVFLASSIMHTLLPYNRSDYQKLPDQHKLLASMRAAGPERKLYLFPLGTTTQVERCAAGARFRLCAGGGLSSCSFRIRIQISTYYSESLRVAVLPSSKKWFAEQRKS